MANKITNEQIIRINELYLEIGAKSKVAKIVGVSPASVTKYLIPNYVGKDNLKIEIFSQEIPDLPIELFKNTEDWGTLCLLSDEEKEECDELRKEILI